MTNYVTVLFGLYLSVSPFHILINDDLFSFRDHNPPPFGAQRPRWHSFVPPIDVGPPLKSTVRHHNPPPSVPQRPHWHSFLPPINVGPPLKSTVRHHNPPPSVPQRPHWHSFLPPIMWDHPQHSFLPPIIDVGLPPNPPWDITIHPLWGPASSLALFPSSD